VITQRISPLDAHLGYWLRYVSNHVFHAFAQKVAARGVSVAEWVMLRELYGAPATPSALATKLGMTRGGISKIVDRLEIKALVTRTSSTTDRRSQTLALTKAGLALVPKLAALADRNDEEFFGHLDAAQRADLATAMREIVRRSGLRSIPLE
jgi:DNA-binding MarR family transcriptional regulator